MKSRHPLLKLLIYIFWGYLVGYFIDPSVYIIIAFSIFVLILCFITSIPNKIKYLLLATLIGINLNSNIELYHFKSLDNHISNSFEGLYDGEVIEILNTNKAYKRFIAKGKVYSSIFRNPHECNSIVTLFDKNNKVEIKPGLEFIANSTFKVGAPKILKEDFNEKSYLISNESLFYTTTNGSKFSVQNENFNISTLLYSIRSDIKNNIYSSVPDSNIAGVIIALTTGDKSGIDYVTKESFSLTGTAHVLAISGLHVGIFSLIIFTLIGFIKSRKKKIIVFSLLIWLFVILTGGHPSAIRAAIMATFIAFLIYYGKVPNLINILLFTVLLYIILDPTIIFSVSFQLSIFAISGIILLYKPIYITLKQLFYFQNSISRFVASSFAISFAATIPTALLTAYYFNTFSTIYPIANLIVLPIMTFAAFQSIFFVLFSSIGLPIADLFASSAYLAIDISVDINNYLVNFSSYFNNNAYNLVYLSLITSIILIYLLTSINLKRFFLRLIVSSFAIVLLLKIETNSNNSLLILPREQSTSLIIERDSSIYVIMSDRKKYDYLQHDYALMKNLINSKKDITFFKTGNVSINFADYYKKHQQLYTNFMDLEFLDSLSNRIYIDNLYRIDKIYD